MPDQSNFDTEKLEGLILEMEKTIFRLSPGIDTLRYTLLLPKIKDNVGQLQDLIIKMGKIIYPLIQSSFMKGVVNSVLDSINVDDALRALKFYNKKHNAFIGQSEPIQNQV
jgi:hypothetical protein